MTFSISASGWLIMALTAAICWIWWRRLRATRCSSFWQTPPPRRWFAIQAMLARCMSSCQCGCKLPALCSTHCAYPFWKSSLSPAIWVDLAVAERSKLSNSARALRRHSIIHSAKSRWSCFTISFILTPTLLEKCITCLRFHVKHLYLPLCEQHPKAFFYFATESS